MNEKLDELIKLRQDNPKLEVVWMVPGETEDEHPYYQGQITKVEKSFYCLYDDIIYIDKSKLIEELENNLSPETEMTDKELDKFVDDEYNLLEKKEVICVYLDI